MEPEQPSQEHPTLTHYQGVEIVSTEPAVGPHPRTKEPTVFRTAIKVLLDDGRVLFICPFGDYDHATSVMSVNNHYSSNHIRKEFRRYKPEVLRAVVRAVKEARAVPGRDYMDRAAQILNARGVRTAGNELWAAHTVSGVYNKYGEEFEHEPRRPRKTTPTAPKTSPNKAIDSLLALARQLQEGLEALAGSGLMEPDPKTAAKAAAWDQMQQNMKLLGD